jgi:hypothetical protein
MASPLTNQVLPMLKKIYEDEVFSSLFRNSPVLEKINPKQYSGESLVFPAIYARSPAISSSGKIAKSIAQSDSTKGAKWEVPLLQKQIFGSFCVNKKEILASKSRGGSFMPVIKFKSFGVIDGIKKQLAVIFYGDGSGTFAHAPAAITALTVGVNTITLKDHELMGVDVGTRFQFGAAATGLVADGKSVNTVTKIAGNIVTFTATVADAVAAGDPLIYYGMSNATENLAPYGLANWAPTETAKRESTFCGVDRSTAPDRLAGQLVDDSAATGTSKIKTIKKMLKLGRRFGGPVSDYILALNDNDYDEVLDLISSQDYYMQDVKSSPSKPQKVIGGSLAGAAFSTSFLTIAIDDPYCPQGTAYMFRPQDVAFVTYSNYSALGPTGKPNNEEGRTDEPMDGPDIGEQPTQININDLWSIAGPETGDDGSEVTVEAALFGSYVVYRQANVVVGKFATA